MKKSALLFALVIIFQFAKAQDESFHKYALVISADWGGDYYGLNEKYFTFTNLGQVFQSKTGYAANTNYNFSAEFGLFKWLGLGLQAKIDNYIISKDASGFQPTAASGELAVLLNLHIVRTHHADLCLGSVFGASNFTYNVDANNDKVYGFGDYGDIHTTLRYYFGRFGFNASVYLPFANFSSLKSNNVNWGLGQDVLAAWAAKGIGFNIGIQFRFLNPPAI